VKNFNNKVAAITGAGSGIGRALAQNLAQQRCHLALSDINAQGLDETATQARALGVTVTTQVLDVADRQAVFAWADQVAADHGKVNLVFNNAGVALSGTVDDLDLADFEWIVNINFWGVIYGTKAFLPHLRASGEGHIINISSLFGLCSQPFVSTYNATKFAVRGFTESLRQELDLEGACVSATSVHPGGIKTNIARAGRVSPNMEKITGKSADESKAQFERLFITSAEQAARVILRAVQKNKRRVLVGRDAKFVDFIVRLFPSGYQRLIVAATRRELRLGR
jgi:short-subunit dehydrogenase